MPDSYRVYNIDRILIYLSLFKLLYFLLSLKFYILFNIVINAISFDIVDNIIAIDDYSIDES